MTDEQFVKDAWEIAYHRDTAYGVLAGPHYVIVESQPGKQCFAAYRHTEGEAWSAAAEFTRERLEQIRQLEAEINLSLWNADPRGVNHCIAENLDNLACGQAVYLARWSRILARLESALADLRKGMKE